MQVFLEPLLAEEYVPNESQTSPKKVHSKRAFSVPTARGDVNVC